MTILLRLKSDPEKTGEVSDKNLAKLALRYAGDDGMSVEGTAAAMEFMTAVRNIKPGQAITIPKTRYELVAGEDHGII